MTETAETAPTSSEPLSGGSRLSVSALVGDLLHCLQSSEGGESTWWEACTAAVEGDLVTLESLLKNNPQLINETDERGRSLLVYAVVTDRLKTLQFLIKLAPFFLILSNFSIRKGVSLSCRDAAGRTVLHYAVQKDAIKCVRHLMSLPRTDEAEYLVKDTQGVTPLHLAARLPTAKCLRV
jgi:ankyrin repeat protein